MAFALVVSLGMSSGIKSVYADTTSPTTDAPATSTPSTTSSPSATGSGGPEFVETWKDSVHSRITSKAEATASEEAVTTAPPDAVESTAPFEEDTFYPESTPDDSDFWDDPYDEPSDDFSQPDAWEPMDDYDSTDDDYYDPWEPMPYEEDDEEDYYPSDWGDPSDYEPDYGYEGSGGSGSTGESAPDYVPPELDTANAIQVDTPSGVTYYLNSRGNNLYFVYDADQNPLGYIKSETQPTAEELENISEILTPFGKTNPETGDLTKYLIPSTVVLLGVAFFVYRFYFRKLKMN